MSSMVTLYEHESDRKIQALEGKVRRLEGMVTALQKLVMDLCDKADIFSGGLEGPTSAYWKIRDDSF